MQTTLRIDDAIYREAKANAALRGVTLTKYLEDALTAFADHPDSQSARLTEEQVERDQIMEGLLKSTAHFRVGEMPSREERNER
ncbi:MAG: hypothetical protein AAF236_09060 [Verrucomicrobiota bacterium]